MASLLPETDSEDEIPNGWEQRVTLDGKVFYANHLSKSTQWAHPITGKKKKVSGELPFGWERQVLPDGTVVFVEHHTKKTTYTDPRLAFAVEEREDKDSGLLTQRFDASSTALQVLHGRDLSGKVAIVTGGNCGIGLETCRALAFHGTHVVMACRNLESAMEAIAGIKQERKHVKLTALHCDLASLQSVNHFAQEFLALNLPLDMLILNAGVCFLPHSITRDKIEMTFQVNHLSHFYLVELLREKLISSSPSRVVVLSSESHRMSRLNKENISEEYLSPLSSRNFSAMMAYNDTKLCNVLFANELNRRLMSEKYSVTATACHPGNMISTNISRYWWAMRLLFAVVRPFTKSVEQGASTSVFCATANELNGIGGVYFNNCCHCDSSSAANDVELASKLWQLSESIIEKCLSQD